MDKVIIIFVSLLHGIFKNAVRVCQAKKEATNDQETI